MHSSLNRIQAVFGFFTTVALVVSALAAVSVLFFPADEANASVQLKNVQVVKGRPHYYSTKREEYAQFRFDLDADLSPLFNWNTKQLFVYVYATYSSSDIPGSQVRASESIIWDTIIPATPSPYSWEILKDQVVALLPSSVTSEAVSAAKRNAKRHAKSAKSAKSKKEALATGVLRLRGQKAKYQVSDVTGRLAQRQNVTLHVGWNVQPWVGALFWAPGTGAAPRTGGTIVSSEPFDFPEVKDNKKAAAEKRAKEAAKAAKAAEKASV
ncbi:Microsomal signal peptidase subunit (Gp23) [Penicillium coprophilum]|uniref:Microsomal signal peptidase subunit (Gp23) n=1 Tax=Penicillium coprophilum TaxID=36646 RepID=UPI0023827DAD|nr:Microsomal signal peptidase subunit (Gp23) [Penicillium coprophilum]KAJ5165504.1 Microsomal signal peptidase subunit (Gp23) [Penicillium coprophilum]